MSWRRPIARNSPAGPVRAAGRTTTAQGAAPPAPCPLQGGLLCSLQGGPHNRRRQRRRRCCYTLLHHAAARPAAPQAAAAGPPHALRRPAAVATGMMAAARRHPLSCLPAALRLQSGQWHGVGHTLLVAQAKRCCEDNEQGDCQGEQTQHAGPPLGASTCMQERGIIST